MEVFRSRLFSVQVWNVQTGPYMDSHTNINTPWKKQEEDKSTKINFLFPIKIAFFHWFYCSLTTMKKRLLCLVPARCFSNYFDSQPCKKFRALLFKIWSKPLLNANYPHRIVYDLFSYLGLKHLSSNDLSAQTDSK